MLKGSRLSGCASNALDYFVAGACGCFLYRCENNNSLYLKSQDLKSYTTTGIIVATVKINCLISNLTSQLSHVDGNLLLRNT